MKVSLNKANKLRNQLEALNKENTSFIRALHMTQGIGNLRVLINDTNHAIGLNKLIGEISSLNKTIYLLGHINLNSSSSSYEDFQAIITHVKKVEEKEDKIYDPKTVRVKILDDAHRKEIQDFIADLKLKLEKLVERRNQLNTSNTIELPKNLVELLRGLRLVE